MASPQSGHLRLWVNGEPLGYQLYVEQVNRAFLRRNEINDDGNLYKLLWFGGNVVERHDKKTNTRTGHDDLLDLLDLLENNKGDALWAVIQKQFEVEQVINYFAVNMVLSHWDGYFNNYFTYHDVKGTGKWEMYPWDQDKTWGFHDASGETVFYDMPVTFGMEGDRPPGFPKDQPPPQGFNGGAWWRPGGYFSKPLLANPQFRKLFLARTRELGSIVDRLLLSSRIEAGRTRVQPTPIELLPVLTERIEALRQVTGRELTVDAPVLAREVREPLEHKAGGIEVEIRGAERPACGDIHSVRLRRGFMTRREAQGGAPGEPLFSLRRASPARPVQWHSPAFSGTRSRPRPRVCRSRPICRSGASSRPDPLRASAP